MQVAGKGHAMLISVTHKPIIDMSVIQSYINCTLKYQIDANPYNRINVVALCKSFIKCY